MLRAFFRMQPTNGNDNRTKNKKKWKLKTNKTNFEIKMMKINVIGRAC